MTMVGSSRKHGHFDGRYQVLPKSRPWTWVCRHDRAALAAHETYMQWLVTGSANRIVPEEAA
jgi:hypothetical protein